MPAIFSVGSFDTVTCTEELVFKSTAFFVKLLDTIKIWSEKAAVKIKAHNEELEPIEHEVLMTVQQMIARAVASAKD